jgi:hypothetical protein
MRTEDEVRERLLEYIEIIGKSSIFTSEFTLANGAKTALLWVLGYDDGEEIENANI